MANNNEFKWDESKVREILQKSFEAFTQDMFVNYDKVIRDFKQSRPFPSKQPSIKEWEIISGQLMDGAYTDIYSVKRLGDGLVFKIGDNVGSKHFSESTIIGFYVKDGNMMVDFSNNDADCNIYWLSPAPLKEIKPFFSQEKVNAQIFKIRSLEAIADILSRVYFYGDFKIETINEKIIVGLLNDLGLFPCEESDILKRPNYSDLFEKYKNFIIQNK